MTQGEAVRTIRTFIESKFPKICSCCSHEFSSLDDYVLNTTHVGLPVSYDALQGNWRPGNPAGTFSLADCNFCGTTLSINSKGLPNLLLWNLMRWARSEIRKRKISLSDLLNEIRTQIEEQLSVERNGGTAVGREMP